MDIRVFCNEKMKSSEGEYYIENDKEYFFLIGKWYRFMGDKISKEKVSWNAFSKNVSLKNCTNDFIHNQISQLWMKYNKNNNIAVVDKITAAILGYTPNNLDNKMDILFGYTDYTVLL